MNLTKSLLCDWWNKCTPVALKLLFWETTKLRFPNKWMAVGGGRVCGLSLHPGVVHVIPTLDTRHEWLKGAGFELPTLGSFDNTHHLLECSRHTVHQTRLSLLFALLMDICLLSQQSALNGSIRSLPDNQVVNTLSPHCHFQKLHKSVKLSEKADGWLNSGCILLQWQGKVSFPIVSDSHFFLFSAYFSSSSICLQGVCVGSSWGEDKKKKHYKKQFPILPSYIVAATKTPHFNMRSSKVHSRAAAASVFPLW